MPAKPLSSPSPRGGTAALGARFGIRFGLRFALSVLFLGLLCWLFWTGSRYPALNEKLLMSGAIQLEDPLSFEARFPLNASMSLIERVFYSTLNWLYTNKQGMTFGLLFGAGFMTALGYLRRRSFDSRLANSLLGLGLGAPLGVCANCAAPIGRGLYASGMRAETALAAMVASPSLNFVVLTMLLTLVPLYMVVVKVALSLVVILGLVPLLCRLLPAADQPGISAAASIPPPPPQSWSAAELATAEDSTGKDSSGEGLLRALWEVTKSYLGNLWYLLRLTVPLMLAAGFLGALVATLLPADLITGLPFAFGLLVVIALVGLFLPVPMGFDVVLCGVLIASGLAQGYVMALLLTLGSFSIYSFFIIRQMLGLRLAGLMALAIASLGVLAGLGAQGYHHWQSQRALEMLLQSQAAPQTPALTSPSPNGGSLFWGAAQAATLETTPAGEPLPQVTSADAAEIKITMQPLAPPSPAGETLFSRAEAARIGIDKPLEFSMRDMWPPFWEGRSLSSGDFDRDGDIDLAVASTEVGLYLYKNDGSGQFARVALDLGALADLHVFNAVLVDIDNDGWQDLFLASYLEGNFWWRNHGGSFGATPPRLVQNRADTPLSMALSFADLDGDGYLDLGLGNWAAGWYRRIPGEESRNRVIFNPDGQLSGTLFRELPGIPGETLSVLFSDFDGDGAQDLIVGNDFDIPDYFYRGDGQGNLTMLTQPEGLIPHTTTTTMSVSVADLFNDGRAEIYLAQIAGRSSGVSERLKMQPLGLYCEAIEDSAAKATCQQNMAIKRWYKSGNRFDPSYAARCQTLDQHNQGACKAMLIKDLAIQKRDASLCALIPAHQAVPRAYCDLHFKPSRAPLAEEVALSHPQILRANVLLEWQGQRYADTAPARGLEVGGWSWDSKVADYDQDGWQDLYIVNGTWVPNEVSPSNLFFRNSGQGGFEEASGPAGLEDYLMTAAASQFDLDGDGDLDLVTHPVNGPLTLFRNNTQQPGLVFQLQDHQGNRDGIGARISLEMPPEAGMGLVQSRDLQLGGGFMSYDAPRAHFGLGAGHVADAARIRWPDGSETRIQGPLRAGSLYQVRRQRE
ncbi:FG-GAP-like repeat-containing protein [Pseudophaeobacter sp.]|uniref:FG-GAP-like repeat-containing protein n=1 Tax=Pseudophaeobacter sp. TaxID=1971739 RepID=UPI003299F2A5